VISLHRRCASPVILALGLSVWPRLAFSQLEPADPALKLFSDLQQILEADSGWERKYRYKEKMNLNRGKARVLRPEKSCRVSFELIGSSYVDRLGKWDSFDKVVVTIALRNIIHRVAYMQGQCQSGDSCGYYILMANAKNESIRNFFYGRDIMSSGSPFLPEYVVMSSSLSFSDPSDSTIIRVGDERVASKATDAINRAIKECQEQ